MKARIYDLTRTMTERMAVYPGDPEVMFESHKTIKDDGVNVTRLSFGTHTGTHIDSPSHFLPQGISVELEPADKFIGEADIVDLAGVKQVTAKDLASLQITSKILLIYTGTGQSQTEFTYLDASAAEWIAARHIKCVGIDTPSVEQFGSREAPVHKILLGNNVGIIENLTNLKEFAGKKMFLVCLPLVLKGLDGAPARAILLEIVK